MGWKRRYLQTLCQQLICTNRLEQLGQRPSLQGSLTCFLGRPWGIVKMGASMSSRVSWKGSLLCVVGTPVEEGPATRVASTGDDSCAIREAYVANRTTRPRPTPCLPVAAESARRGQESLLRNPLEHAAAKVKRSCASREHAGAIFNCMPEA